MAEIIFPTFNVSLGEAVIIVKRRLDDESIPIPTKALAIATTGGLPWRTRD